VLCQEHVVSHRQISSLLHRHRLGSLRLWMPFLLASLTLTPTPKLTQTHLRTVSMATSLRSLEVMLWAPSDASTARTGALYAQTLCNGGTC
jgi:hypothetical protein